MIGIDIIEISRIGESVKKEAFVKRVFTTAEQEYYRNSGGNAQTYAGMFAAKEAVAKALKTGFNGIKHTEIEILHGSSGAPYVRFSGGAAGIFKATGKRHIEISVSHCKEYAAAVCLISQ